MGFLRDSVTWVVSSGGGGGECVEYCASIVPCSEFLSDLPARSRYHAE